MKKNKGKSNLLVFMLICFSINLLPITKAVAETSDNVVARGQGAGGFCICPHCGEKQSHKRGVPCQSVNCPKCSSTMIKDLREKTDINKIDITAEGQGTDGFCICPHCGEKQSHKRGIPCRSVNCPKCKSTMMKEQILYRQTVDKRAQ